MVQLRFKKNRVPCEIQTTVINTLKTESLLWIQFFFFYMTTANLYENWLKVN